MAGSPGSSAQPELQTCALCCTPSRYKCPRCVIPTCSLSCSRKHRQDTGCTGERDKVQYITMNAYGWGTMMRDYCYLEDVGRKVSDWGSQIVRGGYMDNIRSNKVANVRKYSSGRRPESKRDVLRDHLETLGIDVELLPAGMERRNLNQSTFDQKSKSPLLTIELIFHAPTTLASVSSSPASPYKALSHRNSLLATLLTVLQRHGSSALSKQRENAPDWLSPIVDPHPEAPECFVLPHCYIRANTDFPQAQNAACYHKLEPMGRLGELLRKTSFVEFPTIHVFDPEASSFRGTVIDKSGLLVRASEDDQLNIARGAKRRKLNKTVGLKAVFSLVGEYGSEGSSASDEETADNCSNGLAILEAYSGSDDEVTPQNTDAEDNQSPDFDDDVPAEDNQFNPDPARLLELVKQTQSAANEDTLDWGVEWDIDAQEQTEDVEPR